MSGNSNASQPIRLSRSGEAVHASPFFIPCSNLFGVRTRVCSAADRPLLPDTVGVTSVRFFLTPRPTGLKRRLTAEVVGRWGGVHERSKDMASGTDERIIDKWAVSERYDLMDSHVEENGQTIFVLPRISGESWEVPFRHWEQYHAQSTPQLIELETPVTDILAVCKADSEATDYRGTGLFFLITRSGTPALVRLRVHVHDTSLKPGGRFNTDNELRSHRLSQRTPIYRSAAERIRLANTVTPLCVNGVPRLKRPRLPPDCSHG